MLLYTPTRLDPPEAECHGSESPLGTLAKADRTVVAQFLDPMDGKTRDLIVQTTFE